MKTKLYIHVLLIVLFTPPVYLTAQDEGFIYGKIHTVEGQVYEGPIRWGKEEVYWNDIFNAAKERNENLRYLSNREREALDDRQRSNWFTWENRFSNWVTSKSYNHPRDKDYTHQFACQFGEIKTIRPDGKKYVMIELQSGLKYDLTGEGYNDVGTDVNIIDKEIGEILVRWSRIEKIEFNNTPSRLAAKFGEPLYGTVEAYGQKFTGYIQWDHDERLTTDKLDGHSDDGKLSIEFGKIKSIERRGGRSIVVLKSGRELTMDGSNDVDKSNRGIIVMSSEIPAIDIPWSEFNKVVFEEKKTGAIPGYNQFKTQKELRGTVTTREGKSLSGKIVYDLDEAHDHELLQGKEGEFVYSIPFRDVKRIKTKGNDRCTLELKNGKKINLDDAQDVGDRNQGVLVFSSKDSSPAYLPWEEVSEIEFQ